MPISHFIPTYVAEYIDTHERPCEPPWPERDYSSLHPVIAQLAASGHWLEQEALVLDHRFQNEVERMIERISGSDHHQA